MNRTRQQQKYPHFEKKYDSFAIYIFNLVSKS